MPKLKSLSERVAERYQKKKGNVNKTVVIALYDEITKAIQDGWSLRSIWETLHEEKQINFSYASLFNHLKKIKASYEKKLIRKGKDSSQFKNDAIPRKEDLL